MVEFLDPSVIGRVQGEIVLKCLETGKSLDTSRGRLQRITVNEGRDGNRNW